jgi:hypothetical protein
MTFLVDADLPRSAADVVRSHGYDAVDVWDIGLLLDSFLAQTSLIAQLPGKLAIVEPGRARLRS